MMTATMPSHSGLYRMYGDAVAPNYIYSESKVTSPSSKTPTLHASIDSESQANKLHPPLQLGSATACADESVSQPSGCKCNCGMPLRESKYSKKQV